MRNIKLISMLLFIILLAQYLFIGCATSKETKNSSVTSTFRKIYTTYEIGVNYITHIYTLAGAGFEDSDYVETYGDTIPEEDIKILNQNADLMSFLHNDAGIFTVHLYFIPALNNFQTEEEWKDYFLAWEKAVEEKRFSYVESYCTGMFHEYVSSTFENTTNEEWDKIILKELPIFKKIGDVYTRNFNTYKTKVWPEVEPILKERSEELNNRISHVPYVDKWEEVTGYEFGNNDYYIALYYAGINGPSFNNVSLYKNTAFYNHDIGYLLDMFSHELGIHVIKPHTNDLKNEFVKSGVPIEIIYKAGEALATFYNNKVLGRPENDNFNVVYLDIYSRLSKEGITDPRELYEEGIKEYMTNN